MGVYSGFSKDMSTGLIFGVKLPTGDWKYSGFDRDVEIGSGTTDLLLGGYHQDKLDKNGQFGWFAQVMWQKPWPGRAAIVPALRPMRRRGSITRAGAWGTAFGSRPWPR